MIAHAPPPLAAVTTAATPPASAPINSRLSERRKSMSRSIRHCWVEPSALITNENESATSSGWASGWP